MNLKTLLLTVAIAVCGAACSAQSDDAPASELENKLEHPAGKAVSRSLDHDLDVANECTGVIDCPAGYTQMCWPKWCGLYCECIPPG